ncbi:CoxG family protein [Burkholderia plantarii]|uniref:CoxG family protein n=1 Tax=Burkholderia plantarii TaxID=41899 RepID=UPI0018DB73FE|nr:SRPBCC domain-containing protein [Burkholderia plantarii]MBI0327443.1 carbon monoxide dehydrogenase [Burkholderia plantarii]
MELNDALRIPLAPSDVWAALQDLALLRASVEHCEALARLSADDYTFVLTVPLGPLRARYDVRAHLRSPSASRPRRALEFIARSEGIGVLRGQFEIRLAAWRSGDTFGTRIHYGIRATATGALGALPARQIEHALHSLAEDFFSEFSASLLARYGLAPNLATAEPRRRHVFLRPDELSAALRRARAHSSALGGALTGRAPGALPGGRPAGHPLPPWAWGGLIVLVIVLLGLAHWFSGGE